GSGNRRWRGRSPAHPGARSRERARRACFGSARDRAPCHRARARSAARRRRRCAEHGARRRAHSGRTRLQLRIHHSKLGRSLMSSIDGIGAQSRYVPESWEPDEALAEHAATATETFEFTTAGAAVAALLIEHQDLARKQANEAYAAAEKQLEIQAEREYRERLEAA